MPPNSKRSRTDLLALLAESRRERQIAQQTAPLRDAQKSLAAVLDGLNAYGALDDVRRRSFSPLLSAGPAARDGLIPHPWVGVMIWYRPSGYLGYKTLTLMGVWGMAEPATEEESPRLIIQVGLKRLPFAAPFYDAEAYVKLIRKSFDLYYHDDGSPPTTPAQSFVYEAEHRLEVRQTIASVLQGLVG
ncbi:MAG: hypothetical protein U0670_17090 [Anaerolineae bacterium]